MTNDGLSSDLQVWDLGGEESGECDFPEALLQDCMFKMHVTALRVISKYKS